MVTRSWRVPVLGAALFGVIAVVSAFQGSPGNAAGFAMAAILVALLLSPVPFPRPVSAAEALRLHAADGMPIVYWRPGCQFCLRLRATLGRSAARAHWVDIWQDPEGAAAVRAVTGGDETVPTVIINGSGHVNPRPAVVRAALATAERSTG
jgi:mycoredoxin